jgi:hypothetical protein
MAPRECPTTISGSIVECDRGVLSEVIELPGTGLSLSYSTDRLAATNRSMQFGFSCGALAIGDYRLRVTIAGRVYDSDEIVERFCDSPAQRAQVLWDGRDLGGRLIEGAVGVHVWLAKSSIQMIRTCPWNERTRTFGDPASGCPEGEYTELERRTGGAYRVVTWSGQMASLPASASGFGEGWVLSGVHRIDPVTGVVLTSTHANLGTDSLAGEGTDWPPTRNGVPCPTTGMIPTGMTSGAPAQSSDPVVEVIVSDEGDRYYRLRPVDHRALLGQMDRDTCTVTSAPVQADRWLSIPDALGEQTIGRVRQGRSRRSISFLLADTDTVTGSLSAQEATVCTSGARCWSQVFGPTPARPATPACAATFSTETVTGDGLSYRDCWHPESVYLNPYRYILGLVDFIDTDDGRYFVIDHGTAHGQSLYYADFFGLPVRVAGRGPSGDCDAVGDFATWNAAAPGGAPTINGRSVCLDGIRDLALHPDGGVHLLVVPDTNPGGSLHPIGTVLFVNDAGMLRSEAGRLDLPSTVAPLLGGGLVESLVEQLADLLADGAAAADTVLYDPTSIETDIDGAVWVREGRLGRIRQFDSTGASRVMIGCTEIVDGGDCNDYVHQRIGNPTNGEGIYLNAQASFTLTGSEILVVTGTLPAHPGGPTRTSRGLSALYRGTRPAENGERYLARPYKPFLPRVAPCRIFPDAPVGCCRRSAGRRTWRTCTVVRAIEQGVVGRRPSSVGRGRSRRIGCGRRARLGGSWRSSSAWPRSR